MSLLDAVRRPEHTGDRRCWPCTLVNAVVVAVVALVVARRRRRTALLLAAVGAALVWVRGYVVPYTPAFAPRLVAASPLPDEWFHGETARAGVEQRAPNDAGERAQGGDREQRDRHEPGSLSDPDDAETLDGEAVLQHLVEADAVAFDGEGIELTDTFAADWHAEMAPLADQNTEALAAAVDELLPDLSASVVEGVDGDWVVVADAEGGETWLSRPVAIAELAAVRALDGRLSTDLARHAAAPLRMFLTACPDCGSAVVETTTATCCGGYTTPLSEPKDVLSCPSCAVQLFRFEE